MLLVTVKMSISVNFITIFSSRHTREVNKNPLMWRYTICKKFSIITSREKEDVWLTSTTHVFPVIKWSQLDFFHVCCDLAVLLSQNNTESRQQQLESYLAASVSLSFSLSLSYTPSCSFPDVLSGWPEPNINSLVIQCCLPQPHRLCSICLLRVSVSDNCLVVDTLQSFPEWLTLEDCWGSKEGSKEGSKRGPVNICVVLLLPYY
jgi:hypothetical protein